MDSWDIHDRPRCDGRSVTNPIDQGLEPGPEVSRPNAPADRGFRDPVARSPGRVPPAELAAAVSVVLHDLNGMLREILFEFHPEGELREIRGYVAGIVDTWWWLSDHAAVDLGEAGHQMVWLARDRLAASPDFELSVDGEMSDAERLACVLVYAQHPLGLTDEGLDRLLGDLREP
jgi:hypothetical protein